MSKGEARRHTPAPRHLGKLSWGWNSGRNWWVKYRRVQIALTVWPY